MAYSESAGSFLVGEKMVSFARQITPFQNRSILPYNTESTKIKRLGGKKPQCIIEKELRLSSKISDSEFTEIKSKIKKFSDELPDIFISKSDYLEGDQIVCESEKAYKDKNKKKRSHYSASHSCMTYFFEGTCCIAYVDREFKHFRDRKFKSK